ncbi:MAG TPA: serine protease [Longimicrobium sp.]|nr:serine protease [Longimicrobium sp.]
MAILNDFYPMGLDNKSVPDSVVQQAPAVCLVCVVGQPFVTKTGLSPKTSGFYFKNQPLYPNAVSKSSLCAPWADEAAVWMVGTAFAVGVRRFISCWHVVEDVLNEIESSPKQLLLVSGYFRTPSSSKFKYTLLRVLRIERDGLDFCTITTDDSLPSGIRPFDFAKTAAKPGDDVWTVGHPLGQPLKYAEGTVASTSDDRFKAFITYFPGSSGSPVCLRKTGEVLGVLCSGTNLSDFARDKMQGCYTYAKFPNNDDSAATCLLRP